MSINRFAAKIDTTQRELVKALRGIGIQVWIIKKPCDLLLRFWCNRHHEFCWQTLEAKTAYGKKDPKARVDRRQKTQRDFLADTDTPIATTFDEAWHGLNRRHRLHTLNIPNPIRTTQEMTT